MQIYDNTIITAEYMHHTDFTELRVYSYKKS